MDFLLKQRLVGAIVLIALGVIFIPVLLEGPHRNLVPGIEPLPEPDDQPVSRPLAQFPAAGQIPVEPEKSVVQTDKVPAPRPDDRSPKTRHKASSTDSHTLALPIPDEKPGPEPARQAVAGARPAEGALRNWVLQVGSFSNERNALRLRNKLRKAHFVTQVERVRVAGKTHFRVRVGPYLERPEAERDQKKLARTFDLTGRVLSHP